MDMNPKAISERLMKLANDLEKDASEKTYFVCSGCSHTATLSTINGKRTKMASDLGVTKVDPVTVNDKIGCPACDGMMSYVPTEESSKFYVEAGDIAAEAKEIIDEEKRNKEDTFEPVDEQPKPGEEEEVPELDLSFGEDVLEKGPEGEKPEGVPGMEDKAPPPPPMEEGAPEEKPDEMPEIEGEKPPKAPEMEEKGPEMPPDEPIEKTPDMDAVPPVEEEKPRGTSLEEPPAEGMEPPPVEEEEPLPEEKPKKKKKEKEVVDIPKFEKMPKDASEDFKRAVNKYASAF